MYNDLYLAHHGVKGQKWGVRRYQNSDGSLTSEGKKRYGRYGEKLISKIESEHRNYKRDPSRTLREENIESVKTLGKRWLASAGIAFGGGFAGGLVSKLGSMEVGTAITLGSALVSSGYQAVNIGTFINRSLKMAKIANDYEVPDAEIRTTYREARRS